MANYNYKPYKDQIIDSSYITTVVDDENTCIICLDNEGNDLFHYSELTQDCSCNFYIHSQCLIGLIRKKRPDKCVCPLCYIPISNANFIANIDTRQSTEHHPMRNIRQHNSGTALETGTNSTANTHTITLTNGIGGQLVDINSDMVVLDTNTHNGVNENGNDNNDVNNDNTEGNDILCTTCGCRRYFNIDVCCGGLCLLILLFGFIVSIVVVYGVIDPNH